MSKNYGTNYVCCRCGSDRIYNDAWVGINDPDDIKTFDCTYCDECGDHCDIVAEDEYNQGTKEI